MKGTFKFYLTLFALTTIIVTIVTGLIFIRIEDRATRKVNEILLADYAGFDWKLREIKASGSIFGNQGRFRRKCHFDYIEYSFFRYPYQTCFLSKGNNPDRTGPLYYEFSYQKPRSRLTIFGRADTPKSYYFTDGPILGNKLRRVYWDGRITDGKGNKL